MRRRQSYRYRTEVNSRRFVAGSRGCLDFHFVCADEVEFPTLFCLVGDGTDLLQVVDGDAGACLVFDNDKDVFPRFRVLVVVWALREAKAKAVVLRVVSCRVVCDAVLFPRHGAPWVFFVDATALVVVVVLFAVAGRVRSVIGFPLSVPRHEFELKASASSSRTR
ncbi:MAG: hypothetical protein J07HQW2_03488 [Haloquadratum walsbyi J07HQW2]|uniref:Uncharacterized protein n=1 Tax=Haloquadratum walsbyi J07HQW2 TaxID=1238425 RepID=U1PT85_9EURY|nr:MAG: hypothetical protein J07HQW2_03488 [Haloquadratum walsbyi J07HQW2]